MKNQKGITLIALIITIIVMLILVGVSVTVALDGGLFKTAQEAKEKTLIATEKEQMLERALGTLDAQGKVNYDKLSETITEDGKFELYNEGKLEATEDGVFKLVEETDTTVKRVYEDKTSGNVYIVGDRGTITEGVKIVGGDVDGDGAVTSTDAQLLIDYINEYEGVLEEAIYVEEVGDVNGDGAIDNRDYTRLNRYINGMLSSEDATILNKVFFIAPKK